MTTSKVGLSAADIRRLFAMLNDELRRVGADGEIYLVGGAVMCLVLGARDSTRDIDALFQPTRVIREAAARVAAVAGVSSDWLNDAVKRFLGTKRDFLPFLELDHLKVFAAEPHYLLAMKCAAMRLGEEFQDLEDVRYLLRHLGITRADDALAVVTKYFDERSLSPKTRLALEELLER